MENAIQLLQTDADNISLSNLSLTSLHHLEYLATMETVDLKQNKLKNVADWSALQSVVTLYLDDNMLQTLVGMNNLPCLEKLFIRNNSKYKEPSVNTFYKLQVEISWCLHI